MSEPQAFRKWQLCCPAVRRSPDEIGESKRQGIRDLLDAQSRGEARWPLLLHGPAGVGKTCAALCILDYAACRRRLFPGWGPAYVQTPEWVSVLTQAKLGEYEPPGCRAPIGEHELWQWWARLGLVCLDELGARDKVSDTHYEIVKASLDGREGRPLIAISNLAPGDLAKLYDDRIVSRLVAGTVIRFAGKDRRIVT